MSQRCKYNTTAVVIVSVKYVCVQHWGMNTLASTKAPLHNIIWFHCTCNLDCIWIKLRLRAYYKILIKYHYNSCIMKTHATMYCKYYQLQFFYTWFSSILGQVGIFMWLGYTLLNRLHVHNVNTPIWIQLGLLCKPYLVLSYCFFLFTGKLAL